MCPSSSSVLTVERAMSNFQFENLGSSTVKSFASIDFIFNGKSSHKQGDERGGHHIDVKDTTSTKIRFEGEGFSNRILCVQCAVHVVS